MAANFNNSAWFYDRLSYIVYGRALINAQIYLLQYIPANASILIVGGGSGWILEEITKLHGTGLEIAYVEVSAKMMARAKKRNTGNNKVFFINEAIENSVFDNSFDIIMTPFLFDNFTEQTLQHVFNHLHQLLKPTGTWLNCDFQLTGKLWQWLLLKSMFLFFKILCNIEASALPDIEVQFHLQGYESIAQQSFFNGFIISKVYKTQ